MGLPASPLNAFAHATGLAGPEDTFVSINNDTVYSIAQVDSGGPLRLEFRTPPAATTSSSSSTRGRTTSPTSATAPPGPRPARSCSPPPAGTASGADETGSGSPRRSRAIVGRWAVEETRTFPPCASSRQPVDSSADAAAGPGLPQPEAGAPRTSVLRALRVWMGAFPPRARERSISSGSRRSGCSARRVTVRRPRNQGSRPRCPAGFAAGRERLEAAQTGKVPGSTT